MTNAEFFVKGLLVVLGVGFTIVLFPTFWLLTTKIRERKIEKEKEAAKTKGLEDDAVFKLGEKMNSLMEYLQLEFKGSFREGWFGFMTVPTYKVFPKGVCPECGQKKPAKKEGGKDGIKHKGA